MTDSLFLEILKTAMCGERMPADTQISCEDMADIIRLSQLHRVLPMVYDCVYPVCPYDERMQEEIRRCSKLLVLQQTVKTESFLKLYQKLQAQGLEPVVIKGIICRNLYPKPDLRFSADEDLLIPAQEYEIYDKALTEMGLRKHRKRSENYYETSYFSDDGLHIELHTSLFPTELEYFDEWNRIFENASDFTEYVQINSVNVRTLSPADHLIFLILHSLKHFVHSGVGIRQICDIVIFAQHFGAELDWEKVCSCLSQLSAEKFTAGLFNIGSKHLGFDGNACGYPEALGSLSVNEDYLLRDILCAGVYGGSTMSRRHSAGMTFGAVQGRKADLVHRLFPSGSELDSRYKYAKDNPLLLPAAWVHRIIRYMSEVDRKGDNSPAESVKTGKERIELLRRLGLLPEE